MMFTCVSSNWVTKYGGDYTRRLFGIESLLYFIVFSGFEPFSKLFMFLVCLALPAVLNVTKWSNKSLKTAKTCEQHSFRLQKGASCFYYRY